MLLMMDAGRPAPYPRIAAMTATAIGLAAHGRGKSYDVLVSDRQCRLVSVDFARRGHSPVQGAHVARLTPRRTAGFPGWVAICVAVAAGRVLVLLN
jgi:hypothetical protein